MAGLEFLVPTGQEERPFARLLLRYSQELAGARQCQRPTELRYRWRQPSRTHPYRHYQVFLDGDFAELQAFCADMSIALHHFAKGVVVVTPSLRSSLLPAVIPIALAKALLDLSGDMAKVVRDVSGLGAPVVANSYLFQRTGNREIDAVTGALSQALLHWRSGRLGAAVVAEQVHTATELLLKKVLGAPNRDCSFAEMVGSAAEKRLVTSDEGRLLLQLKDMRRDGKHRGQAISEKRLLSVLQPTIGVLHRLVSAILPCEE